MRTTYIVIGILVLLTVGGFVLARNGILNLGNEVADNNNNTITPPPPAPSGGTVVPVPPPADSQTVTVTYTSVGYSPKTVTIKKNDTVKFVNSSGKNFWPASAIHPTHEIYPAFDPKKTLASGESWSFTFDQVGTWRYHDHLDPSKTGTVVVTE